MLTSKINTQRPRRYRNRSTPPGMSLVRPGFWNPSTADFALALLDRRNAQHGSSWGLVAQPLDYVCSILIGLFFLGASIDRPFACCTLFLTPDRLGLQVCLLWALIRGSQKYARCSRRDKEQTMRPTPDKRKRPPFCFPLTLCLPPLFMIGMAVQSVNFGIRIWSLGVVKDVSGHLDNEFGTTVCRAAICLEATPHFNRVARGLEMTASLLFQTMILIADLLLVCVLPCESTRHPS